MAKKVAKIKEAPEASGRPRTCGNCAHGKYLFVQDNLDMAGNPICVQCDFDRRWWKVRSDPGCKRHSFKAKKNSF